jgi:hypothetical protein
MKTKKFDLNWQSVLLGMMLCMVLVVFVGSKLGTAQATAQDGTIKSMIEPSEMQKQITAIDKDLTRIEKKIDGLVKDMDVIIKIMWVDLKKK